MNPKMNLQSVRFQYPVQTVLNDRSEARAWNRRVRKQENVRVRYDPAGCGENYVWQGFFVCGEILSVGDCYVQSSVICCG